MGRPRVPVEKRVLDGTYQASRHGPIPSDLAEGFAPPVKPADLTGDAGQFWDTMSRLLAGVARDRDSAMLAELCWHWAELRRIKKTLAAVKPGAKGYNQLLVAVGICTDKFDKIAGRFGLTPSDRAKLGADKGAVAKAKVATRPKTALDRAGPPVKPKGKGKR